MELQLLLPVLQPSAVSEQFDQPQSFGVSLSQQRLILDTHNKLRSMVASGQTDHPPASNMRQLVWDEELASLAQVHANQCRFVHDCAHCRRVARWFVGQNLLRDRSEDYQPPDWDFTVNSWFREIYNYPNRDNSAVYKYIDGTGHFIQMIWAETRTVGCGMVTYISRDNPNKVTRYYACHYGPVGNFIGQQIYSPGSPCSRCPHQTQCSNSYSGLCQENNQRTNFRITKVEKIKNEIGNYSTRILPNRNSISPRIARIVHNSRAKSSRIARIPNSRTKSSKTESVHQIPSADSRPRNSCQDIFCSILQFFSQ